MTTDTNPARPAAPKDFAQAYTKVLGHILRFQEESTNYGLSATFKLAGSFQPTDNVWQAIQSDLADKRTQGLLYGDYLSDSPYPWIKDPQTLGMIVRHAAMLGEDKGVVDAFVQRTEEVYGTRPEPSSLVLVA
jgi:hypothetical protein